MQILTRRNQETPCKFVFADIFCEANKKINLPVNFSVAAKIIRCYIQYKNNSAQLYDHKKIPKKVL
jgi:hypothetical protein